LNFGSPERSEPYWALSEAIDGITEACLALGVPVVSGNVSLYNETGGGAIAPSPIIGMIGLIDDLKTTAPTGFQDDGDAIVLLGPPNSGLECSEYLATQSDATGPAPDLDLAREVRGQNMCRQLVARGLARSAQDCSDGGLVIALAECAIAGDRGFVGSTDALESLRAACGGRLDAVLFGEAQSRFVVSCRQTDLADVSRLCAAEDVECTVLGQTGGQMLQWGNALKLSLDALRIQWAGGLKDVIA